MKNLINKIMGFQKMKFQEEEQLLLTESLLRGEYPTMVDDDIRFYARRQVEDSKQFYDYFQMIGGLKSLDDKEVEAIYRELEAIDLEDIKRITREYHSIIVEGSMILTYQKILENYSLINQENMNASDMIQRGNEVLLKAVGSFRHSTIPFSSYLNQLFNDTFYNQKELKKELQLMDNEVSLEMISGVYGYDDSLLLESNLCSRYDEVLYEVLRILTNEGFDYSLSLLSSNQVKMIPLFYGLDCGIEKRKKQIAEIFGCSSSTINQWDGRICAVIKNQRLNYISNSDPDYDFNTRYQDIPKKYKKGKY